MKALPGAVPPVIATYQPPRGGHRVIHQRAEDADSISGNSPGPAIVNGGSTGYFEALHNSPNRTQLPYLANIGRTRYPILEGLNRRQLAALGRYLVDNGGNASYAVELIVNNSTPVWPQAMSDDDAWNKEQEAEFALWAKRCEYTGRFNFKTVQRMLCKSIDTDGDVGAAMTLQNGFPQIRCYDTFDIGSIGWTHKTDGVLYTNDGVVVGYNVVEGFSPNERERRLGRDEMMLLYDPERFHHYRGFSPMRRGSNDLRDAKDIKGFTKLAAKIASALAGVIKGGTIEENVWGDDSAQDDGGNAPEDDDKASVKKLTLAELLGGDIPVIDGEFQQLSHNNPGANTVEFLNVLDGMFVSGLHIPPAYYLDEKLTGPNTRGVLGKAQKKFNTRICMMCDFAEFVWLRWMAWRINVGLTKPVAGWWKTSCQVPSKLVIDLGDQMSNEREDVLVGQMSRRERYGNRGMDWQNEEDQISGELDYIIASCQKLATKLGVPLETILTARGIVGAAKEEAQEGANENNKKAAKESSK